MTVPESMIVPDDEKTDAGIDSFWPPTLIPVTSRPYNDGLCVESGVNFTEFEMPPPPLPRVR